MKCLMIIITQLDNLLTRSMPSIVHKQSSKDAVVHVGNSSKDFNSLLLFVYLVYKFCFQG